MSSKEYHFHKLYIYIRLYKKKYTTHSIVQHVRMYHIVKHLRKIYIFEADTIK